MPRTNNGTDPGRPHGGASNGDEADYLKLAALAQKHTAEALETLASLMRFGRSEQVRLAAASALLDRGYGKPAAQVDVSTRTRVDVVYRTEREFRQALIDRGIPVGLLPPPLVADEVPDDENQ
jgi:hypothetical protein